MEAAIAKVMESIPGFKFHPSDEELLLQHLRPKIEGTQADNSCVVPEVEVCQYDPWHLPKIFHELSIWKSRNGTREWAFLCPRKRKYSNSQRSERTTPSGHWKVTGAKRNAKADDGLLIGIKKTLVFHKGRVPKGKRTNWIMHEFHLNVSCLSDNSYGDQLPYVACRIKLKKDNKGMNTDDYPTQYSDRNSPFTIDVADYLQFNEDNSSSCNTPASTGDVYHDATADQYARAYQLELSSDDIPVSFPIQQQLDNGVTIDVADYLQFNEDNSSACNTPASTGYVYHDATADQYTPAYQHELSSDDISGSFPNQQQLDNGVTIDVADYLQFNEDNSSARNTPASTGDVYHDATADQYAPAYQHELSSDDISGSFLNQQQLDNGVTPEYNAYNGDNAFYYGGVPPSPPLFSPSSLSDCDSYINWDYVPNGYNDYN